MLQSVNPEGKTLADFATLRGYVARAKLYLEAYIKNCQFPLPR